jgi:hypothetical protein
MPHYPQQQHDTCSASTGRRKHLNLLLFDQLDEIKRIYAGACSTAQTVAEEIGPLRKF